jgi:large subunit ribosomal protein L20
MARTKSIAARRHRKIKARAKGFKQARRTRVKAAKEALLHAGQYAYVGRKLRKRDMRSLWIIRLNSAAREHGLNYNQLVYGLKKAQIQIDRKILADIAVSDSKTFAQIVEKVKGFTSK